MGYTSVSSAIWLHALLLFNSITGIVLSAILLSKETWGNPNWNRHDNATLLLVFNAGSLVSTILFSLLGCGSVPHRFQPRLGQRQVSISIILLKAVWDFAIAIGLLVCHVLFARTIAEEFRFTHDFPLLLMVYGGCFALFSG